MNIDLDMPLAADHERQNLSAVRDQPRDFAARASEEPRHAAEERRAAEKGTGTK